ncbi:MAG: winged helix-turn-helix transcriptional regulator [bacterium]
MAEDSATTQDPNGVMDRDEQMILSLLTAIADEPDTTQKDLATQLGIAVGMVNSYLKRVVYKGYVKTKHLQRRRLRYLLTPSGIKEKTRLTYEFLRYSYQFIREVRSKTTQVLFPFARDGKKRVVFYGSGEIAELAYLAVRELGMELVGVVDPDHAGRHCVDHTIHDLAWLRDNGHADILLVLNTPPERDNMDLKEIAQQLRLQVVSVP